MKSTIQILKDYLKSPRKIVLFTHVNPDGDAMGALMGLYHFLKKLKHQVVPITPNDFPLFLAWFKDVTSVIVYSKEPEKVNAEVKNADIIFCIDFNDFRRLKDIEPLVKTSKAIKVLIDHHPNPSNLFDYYIHRVNASAAAELVYDFIFEMGYKDKIDNVIAECIYAGIMSDTNSFNYNINNSLTFRKVADLLEYGIDHNKIFGLIYDNYSLNRMRLMGHCLNQKLITIPQLHFGYIWLTRRELETYNFRTGDTEGFVNLPLSIGGIYISALFVEKDNFVRISCRSKGEFAVNQLCARHFEGGGHKNAAGGEIYQPIEQAIKHFETILTMYENEIRKLYSNI